MAGYTVRVEMHRATEEQYQRLHAAMAQAHYLRKILGDDGKWYVMPTAEYRIASTDWTSAQILAEVQVIADNISPRSWVFVTQGDKCTWRTKAA